MGRTVRPWSWEDLRVVIVGSLLLDGDPIEAALDLCDHVTVDYPTFLGLWDVSHPLNHQATARLY